MKNIDYRIIGKFKDPKTGLQKVCIRVPAPNGIQRFSMLMSEVMNDVQLTNALVDHGIENSLLESQKSEILNELRGKVDQAKYMEITTTTGWMQNNQFVMHDKTIPKAERRTMFHARTNEIVPRCIASGKLEIWKSSIMPLTQISDLAVFVIALAFSGPLIGLFKEIIESPVFNLCGPTSGGKSSILKIASTVFGLDQSGELLNFDTTAAGLEEMLEQHNHLFLAIDEETLSEAQSSVARRKFAMRITGGTGKKRSRNYSGSDLRAVFKLAVATSSNRQVGAAQDDPTKVRWIDLRVANSHNGGIIRKLSFEQLGSDKCAQIIDQAVIGAVKNQRLAGNKFIRLLANPKRRDEFFRHHNKCFKSFLERHGAGLGPAQIRVVKKFALVYSLATLLPSLELVPWGEKQGQASVEQIFRRHKSCHSNDFVDEMKLLRSLHALLKEPKHFRKYTEIESIKEVTGIGIKASVYGRWAACIRRNDNDVSEKLKAELGFGMKVLEPLLRKHNLLVKDGNGKLTWAANIKRSPNSEKSRIRFMPIDVKKLAAFVKQ